jgi:hypothetical protein
VEDVLEDGSSRTVLSARVILQALALHVMPVLYGLLGACAFILRRIAAQLRNSTFEATSIFRYRIRQGLGVVLGLAVVVLPWSVGADVSQISLTTIAVAFLAGYNVDAVFAPLDRWLDRLRDPHVTRDDGRPPAIGANAAS